MGVLEGIVEAYTGERGFMGAHRYKVFGILEVAAKTGRTETNGASGAGDETRPWEETHRQFSDAMKERLEPFRGNVKVEPHEMRGTFEECRYLSHVLGCSSVDSDPTQSVALVTLDIRNTGITFAPGDRLAIMPLNSWEECAKVAAALGLEDIDVSPPLTDTWARFELHLGSVRRGVASKLKIGDILRRGHLAPITKDLALKVHEMLHASSNTVLQVLAAEEWPVYGSLGDLLQHAIIDTPSHIWDKAFCLDDLSWLTKLIPLEVPRTYSIASYTDELLPETVDLAISRAEHVLSASFSQNGQTLRAGVASGFLNPLPKQGNYEGSDEILIGVSRPVAFQLPLDSMSPCAFFAGGSGIAPFRSFWQARLVQNGLSGGRNILYFGVQSREKFCFEEELREYVRAGFMEVHVAFSRDSRGLVYDNNDLFEKEIPPRYINSLIIEQGDTVCDLVMSKKQGGLGGQLYICGSVGIFDSVMNGIRKAIYNCRTATMESVDIIINKAFAERRIMLDVFMTPKALPCNLPTISLSQLAMNTGHRPGSRIWIGVHGSVYDVTDFSPMHPGGTLIIKSNAGVDCSKSFDNLAHTNNPEVSSLLTKYFIGNLNPKPDTGHDEISALYDLWAAYLRTTVETLVAHQFEMNEIMGASTATPSTYDAAGSNNIWLRESLPNILAVRTFYAYQSRLLQGGFAALFGPKMQELVLKLSFTIASSNGPEPDAKLPDVLGAVARAKTSPDAVSCSKELSMVGALVCDTDASLRFQERGVFNYAAASVELDIELLEDLRKEACSGMDAFEHTSLLSGEDEDWNSDFSSSTSKISTLSAFLLHILDRMARRLEAFYSRLAQCSVYQPEIEHNPARTRWALVRRRVRDGSFFIMTSSAEISSEQSNRYYMPPSITNQQVYFDSVLQQLQSGLHISQDVPSNAPHAPLTMNAVHQARGRSTGDASALATFENTNALRAMNAFVEKHGRDIRRLSRAVLPASIPFEEMQREGIVAFSHPSNSFGGHKIANGDIPRTGIVGVALPTPPSSRGSSRSSMRSNQVADSSIHVRGLSVDTVPLANANKSGTLGSNHVSKVPTSSRGRFTFPVLDNGNGYARPGPAMQDTFTSMMNRNGIRHRNEVIMSTNTQAVPEVSHRGGIVSSHNHSRSESTNTLRTFRLRSLASGGGTRVAPTF